MKKISKKDLNKRMLRHGSKVTTLVPAPPPPPDAKDLIAKLARKQETDFMALADAISRVSEQNIRTASEVREIKMSRGTGRATMKIHRLTGSQLIKAVDLVRVTADGERRAFQCDFERDGIGNVRTVNIREKS